MWFYGKSKLYHWQTEKNKSGSYSRSFFSRSMSLTERCSPHGQPKKTLCGLSVPQPHAPSYSKCLQCPVSNSISVFPCPSFQESCLVHMLRIKCVMILIIFYISHYIQDEFKKNVNWLGKLHVDRISWADYEDKLTVVVVGGWGEGGEASWRQSQ